MHSLTFKNFPLILALLLPFTYLIGVLITEIVAFLLIIFFLIRSKDFFNYFNDRKIIFLLIFSIYVALNSLVQISDDLKYSSLVHFRYVLFALSIYYFFEVFFNENRLLKKPFLYLISIILILLYFDSLLQFFSGKNLTGYEIQKLRVSSFFGSELVLGSFLIKILPYIFWLIFFFDIDFEKKRIKFFLINFFTLYLITIYISAERLSFILMIFLFFFIFIYIKKIRNILIYSFTFFILFVIIVANFNLGKSPPHHRIFVETFNQVTNYAYHKCCKDKDKLNMINEKKQTDIEPKKENKLKKNLKFFSPNHHGHIVLAYDLFKKNKIFGVGPKGFRHYCRSVNYNSKIGLCSTHPHNFLIQFLSELGLLGMLFYLITFYFLISKTIKCTRSKISLRLKNSFYVISIGLIINFFPFLPSGNFFNNWNSFSYFYLIGIYLYTYRKCLNRL